MAVNWLVSGVFFAYFFGIHRDARSRKAFGRRRLIAADWFNQRKTIYLINQSKPAPFSEGFIFFLEPSFGSRFSGAVEEWRRSAVLEVILEFIRFEKYFFLFLFRFLLFSFLFSSSFSYLPNVGSFISVIRHPSSSSSLIQLFFFSLELLLQLGLLWEARDHLKRSSRDFHRLLSVEIF